MKVLLVLAAAISTAAAFGFAAPREHLNRNISYSCSKLGDIGTMKVFVHTTDELQLIYLEEPDDSAVNSIGLLDSNGNGVTGDGAEFDPYYFEIDVNCSLTTTLSVVDPAGLPSRVQDPDLFTIALVLKSIYTAPWYADLYFLNDSRHELTCNFSEASQGDVTISRFITNNINGDGVLLTGGSAILEMVRAALINPTFVAGLGEDIFFRLSLGPTSDAVGVVGYDCFACATDPCQNPVPLIDANGCSVNPNYFTGFAYDGVYYVTSTFPAFKVERSVLLYVTCSVDFCYQPGDPKCLNFCNYNGGPVKRKKRQTAPESKAEKVRSYFRIEVSPPEDSDAPVIVQTKPVDQITAQNDAVHAQNTGLLAAVVTLAALLLVCLIVAVVVFVHLSTRSRKLDGKA